MKGSRILVPLAIASALGGSMAAMPLSAAASPPQVFCASDGASAPINPTPAQAIAYAGDLRSDIVVLPTIDCTA
jgi:hypothetical protein